LTKLFTKIANDLKKPGFAKLYWEVGVGYVRAKI